MWRFTTALLLVLLMATAGLAAVYQAGTSYAVIQHNGSVGRMIGIDAAGRAHVVWMKSFSPSGTQRHVYYNLWDPAGGQFLLPDPNGGGVQVNASNRAGYANVAVLPEGWAFPMFHQSPPAPLIYTAGAIDFMPGMGAFTTTNTSPCFENSDQLDIIWPKCAIGPDSVLHVVATENPSSGLPHHPQRIFYARGIPTWADGFGLEIEWQLGATCGSFARLDTNYLVTAVIAASPVSDRVVIALSKCAGGLDTCGGFNNDVALHVSEDGGLNWGAPVNITNVIPPDTACHNATGNDVCCSRDTLRPYSGLSLVIDTQDHIHLAFATVSYHHWVDGMEGPFVRPYQAMLWHWSDQNAVISFISEHRIAADSLPVVPQPFWAALSQPSLSLGADPSVLYCSFVRSEAMPYDGGVYLNGEIYVASSTDGGANWIEGVNVTNTVPEELPPPAGGSTTERDVSLATTVARDSLHLFYQLDTDDGQETRVSNYPLYYRTVAVADLPLGPTVAPRPFHVALIPCDTLNAAVEEPFIVRHSALTVSPNPFNSAATIRFDLDRERPVELTVYDLLGREVATLADDMLSAGVHARTWNTAGAASGIYFVTLYAGGEMRTQKLMLLK